MAELDFHGRVAIVTGAGSPEGLGRSYAMLLASRGARVVVNDVGTGMYGAGLLPSSAEAVAAEIVGAGGEAIADSHSVAGVADAAAIVQTAVDAWGKVDILVNNAGVAVRARFGDLSVADIERLVGVHLVGTIWMCRAAWPLMKESGYGRIVNTGSRAMFGVLLHPIYGAAKAGVYGLTRALAVDGAEFGIVVNSVSPAAGTTAVRAGRGEAEFTRKRAELPTELVAPVVAYMAHERCRFSGLEIEAAGGLVAAEQFTRGRGYESRELTIEDIERNLGAILDATSAENLAETLTPTALDGAG